MTYAVKELFLTVQGEGANTGRPAVFVRFAGCNLWSGREEDRATAVCRFCDTDFVGTDGDGGGAFGSARALGAAIAKTWEVGDAEGRLARARAALPWEGPAERFCVLTGGEPLLQLDTPLLDDLHRRGFRVAVETNGTRAVPAGVDWICVSPKAGAALVQRAGHELKLVYPQPDLDPEDFRELPFDHFFLQPMDGPDRDRNTAAARDYCDRHPPWRVSLQMHKLIGVP